MSPSSHRYFLLSPANCSGRRAQLLLRAEADFNLAKRLRCGEATIAEVFAFLSSLYFRGKLAYARHFAHPKRGEPGALVITPDRGLLDLETKISLDDLNALAAVPVDLKDSRYRGPFERDAKTLALRIPRKAEVVLLGSVATSKYTEVLAAELGSRLLFPKEFRGRGDMSRGALLLRCTRSNTELAYVPVADSTAEGHNS